MKKTWLCACISTILLACGGGSDGPGEPLVNKDPSVPSLSQPENNLLCTNNNLTFSWNSSSDPDGDPLSYTLEISKNQSFTELAHNFGSLSTTSKTVLLDRGIAYYWRVKAKDNRGGTSAYSTINQLYTEGDGEINYLPFSPVLTYPTLGATISNSTISLSWSASHVDNNATLSYDVYLDLTNPPTTIVANGINQNSFSVNLSAATSYYWKVVVKDNHGGITHGQIWSFSTP